MLSPTVPRSTISRLTLIRTNVLIFGSESIVIISMTLSKIQVQNVSNSPTDFAMQNKSKMINSVKVCSSRKHYLIQYIESPNLLSACKYGGLGSFKKGGGGNLNINIHGSSVLWSNKKKNHSDIIK